MAIAPLSAQDNAVPGNAPTVNVAPPAPATSQATPPPAPVITAPTNVEPELTLDELVQRALANSPQIPVARLGQDAAREHLRALRVLENPTVETTPGLGNPDARDEYVLFSQRIDIFGQRRALANVAAADLRRTQAETTQAERSLVVAVKNAAADLFAAQEAESLGGVQVEVAQLFRNAAARRAELGDVPPVQVQRADLELLRAQNDYINAQTERLSRRATLNQLIGQPPETPLRAALPFGDEFMDVLHQTALIPSSHSQANGEARGAVSGSASSPTSNELHSPVTSSHPNIDLGARGRGEGVDLTTQRANVLPGALSNRPDVLVAQATLESRRAQVTAVQRQRLPVIDFQLRRAPFFGHTEPPGGYAVRLFATFPIFDIGSIRHERRAAEADVRAQEANITLLKSQVATQVEQALLRLEQQRQTVQRYHSGIVPLAIDLLRKTQIGYAAGASTYLEVVDAQRALRQVQTEYLQALAGVRTGEATLESAVGVAPPGSGSGPITNPTGPSTPAGVAAPGTVPDLAPPTTAGAQAAPATPSAPNAPNTAPAPATAQTPALPAPPTTPSGTGRGGQ
ncbi:MAG: TolC family protein [Abitibacteriaceae bacterium]|nr:TolC family protein [Abditibacteriaceae bacterium]MBV9866207.1 TolC family protein [Abditibacteriaceae bacterium]